jgi:hypothetical protein
MPRKGAVGLNVTTEARESIRQLAYRLTGQTGQRVTMDAAIRAACQVATTNLAATGLALEGSTDDQS